MSTHHNLDPFPEPRDKSPMYINEPYLAESATFDYDKMFAEQEDNIRVYVPLDINKELILRRLYSIVARYGEANEDNEMNFSAEVDRLISQIEIYDQIWYVRHMPTDGSKHSKEAVELVREFVEELREIPDGCAECFPFEVIEELEEEYL